VQMLTSIRQPKADAAGTKCTSRRRSDTTSPRRRPRARHNTQNSRTAANTAFTRCGPRSPALCSHNTNAVSRYIADHGSNPPARPTSDTQRGFRARAAADPGVPTRSVAVRRRGERSSPDPVSHQCRI
jgi:hypothetical protein